MPSKAIARALVGAEARFTSVKQGMSNDRDRSPGELRQYLSAG
jgi:hypothetical protein